MEILSRKIVSYPGYLKVFLININVSLCTLELKWALVIIHDHSSWQTYFLFFCKKICNYRKIIASEMHINLFISDMYNNFFILKTLQTFLISVLFSFVYAIFYIKFGMKLHWYQLFYCALEYIKCFALK